MTFNERRGGAHPLPQPDAGPWRRRRCRSRGAAPAAAWKVSRRFWGALPPPPPPPPTLRPRPWCRCRQGGGTPGCGRGPPARPVPPCLPPPPPGDPLRPGRRWADSPHNFLGGSGGAEMPSQCPPPHPTSCRNVWPRPGPRGRGRGAGGVPAAPSRPDTCGAGGRQSPAGAGQGSLRHPHCPGTRWRYRDMGSSALAPQPEEGISSAAPAQPGLCLAVGPGPSHVPTGAPRLSLCAGDPLGWGGCVSVRCSCPPGLQMKGSFFSGKRTSGSCEVSALGDPPTRFTPHR
ncbi:formin-like protein 3 [Corapipo altera]|uniref:formin-like protein 3 n=1 Tax=Corapipo altera TaxID=415028 RepID=UPI000FD62FD3|nr:formin-like protein 3 [Corapipo altera]